MPKMGAALMSRQLLTAVNNQTIRRLLLAARLLAHRNLAPLRHRALASDRRTALAAAVRMVVRVHNGTAHLRTASEPAAAARLADGDVLMLEVPDLADRCTTVDVHTADLTGRQTQKRVVAFLRHELCRCARTACQLRALADLELYGMNNRTERDILERKRVPRLDVSLGTRLHNIADLEAVRCEDVALLAVCVVQQRDARTAVRIVFDRRDTGRNSVLRALKVNDAVEPVS